MLSVGCYHALALHLLSCPAKASLVTWVFLSEGVVEPEYIFLQKSQSVVFSGGKESLCMHPPGYGKGWVLHSLLPQVRDAVQPAAYLTHAISGQLGPE